MGPIIFLRGSNPGPQFNVEPQVHHAHFGRGNAAKHHNIGQAAQMADPKHLTRNLAQPNTKCDAVGFRGMGHDIGGIEASGRFDRADRVGI